jgi:putative tricarboxylic transport membrane protein
MKKAEIIMATFWAALSVALLMEIQVIPGTKQPIGWESGVGPQSGWFPFYLALIMLVCSLIVLLPKVLQAAKEGLESKPFVTVEGLVAVLWAFGPMFVYVVTIPWLGFYLGSTLYIIYYIRFVGKHSWTLSLSTGVIFSVSVFLVFEKALKLTLAKGFIEPVLNMFL